MSLYSRAVRPALFALDAERAHDLTMTLLRQPLFSRACRLMRARAHDSLRQEHFGLAFANPVGLAAGLDKNGVAIGAWAELGFGFAEIGTVTPLPQPGNPRPRLFRLREDLAIINRFGFNSAGGAAVARTLARAQPLTIPLGINIGKNKQTSNERAVDDYLRAVEQLHSFADYFVINVSSPNTSGLRDLQESRTLRALAERVVHAARTCGVRPIPVLVKVSPDMSDSDLCGSVDAIAEAGASGVIATNTTVNREALMSSTFTSETGGLSGAPLRDRANAACALLYRHLGGRLPIIGVGGIFDADDAYARIRAGASLIQVYTGMIYEGPTMVAHIVEGLARYLARDGVSTLSEVIGADVH